MTKYPAQALVLCCSLLLAAPAGWCLGLSEPGPADRSESCCRQDTNADDAGREVPPKPAPEYGCCCAWTATLSQRMAQSDDDALPAYPAPLKDLLHLTPPSEPFLQALAHHRSFGPPLHVLKCVWRL